MGKVIGMETVTSPATKRIWSSPDAVLILSTGLLSEFVYNKAVDWLFVARSESSELVERLLHSTEYLQMIFAGDQKQALATVQKINRIHDAVELKRGDRIGHWAYRDIIFTFIDYGEKAHEIVFGSMSEAERQEHFGAMRRLGLAMGIVDMPDTYADYRGYRHRQLVQDYARNGISETVHADIEGIVGPWRYRALLTVQAGLLPSELAPVMKWPPSRLVYGALKLYRYMPKTYRDSDWLTHRLLPEDYARRFTRQLRELPGDG